MGCKGLVPRMLDDDRSYSQYRFRLVASQLQVLRGCHPLYIPRSLDEFPATVDWTSERALQDIPDTMWESARILLQCVLVSPRLLLVEELAEFLAFDFNAGAKAGDRSSRRYHVCMTRAHTTVAEACLRILLSLNGEASGGSPQELPSRCLCYEALDGPCRV
jgi:hypothetical protein